jgi:hypothetical protein
MYTAIKHQQILQPLPASNTRTSMSSLSPGGGAAMMRNRSLRTQPDRLTTLKRGSIRGIQSILSAQSAANPYGSSTSSVDGRVSPSPSFATSTHEVRYFHVQSEKYSKFSRPCMAPVPRFSTQPLDSPRTYHTPSSARLKKTMTAVFIARVRPPLLSAYQTKSLLCSVLLGLKKACSAANNIGNPRASVPKTNHGSMFLWLSRRAN